MKNNSYHTPILVNPLLDHFNLDDSSVIIDATLGFGGHAEAILSKYPTLDYVGIDRDPFALEYAQNRCQKFPNFRGMHGRFSTMIQRIQDGLTYPTHVLMDLGVSSYQLDQSKRGFSFQREEPLDMRMSPNEGMSASTILMTYSETALTDMIQVGGDIRGAHRFAAAIIAARKKSILSTTSDVVQCIKQSMPCRSRREFIALTTRIFQAIRIEVNQELQELQVTLNGLATLNIPLTIAVISFQPNEDRWVKQFMKTAHVSPMHKKPFKESYHACKNNPRATSALLRLFRLNDRLLLNT